MYKSHWVGQPDFPSTLGNKACNLHRLSILSAQRGFAVPEAFVVGPSLLTTVLKSVTGLTAYALSAEYIGMLESPSTHLADEWSRGMAIAQLDPSSFARLDADYRKLCDISDSPVVSVRSSFQHEDGHLDSYAGVFETTTNVRGTEQLVRALLNVYASVFTRRAIAYQRASSSHGQVLPGMSVIVQRMVGGEDWQGGVALTTAPDTHSKDVLFVSSSDHCENVTSGTTCPEEFFVDKPNLKRLSSPIIQSTAGTHTHETRFRMSDRLLCRIATVFADLESSFGHPLNIEWATDSHGRLFILQAREQRAMEAYPVALSDADAQTALVTGSAVGTGRRLGVARVVNDLHEDHHLGSQDILITKSTDPDWDPILSQVAAVITEDGGRGSHTSILARERGMLALVGAPGATTSIPNGSEIALLCEDGFTGAVYAKHDIPSEMRAVEKTSTLEVPNPYRAFSIARLQAPEHVILALDSWITRFAPTRVDHKTQATFSRGYRSYLDFLSSKIADGIYLVFVAFPGASVSLRRTERYEEQFLGLSVVLDDALRHIGSRAGRYPEVIPLT